MIQVLRAAWPLVLGIVVFVAFGRLGFNPTDEGLINDAAYRILRGEVPHRDFVWAKPAGTALLHVPELLLPTPLVMTSRAIALAQVIGYSLLFAVLVTGRAPWRWGLSVVALVGIATLLNLNTMLLTAWPTFDGLLLVGAGAVVLRRSMASGGRRGIVAGFLLLGAAAFMKQSFWPAPIFGLVWLLGASPRERWKERLLPALAASAVFPVAYLLTMVAAGGLDEMLLQFGSARAALGIELVTELPRPPIVAVLAATVALLVWAPRRVPGVAPLAPVLVALMSVAVVTVTGLRLSGAWGSIFFWMLVASVVSRGIRDRAVDWPGMVLIGSAWMASLSYGVAVPNLISGSMIVYLVHRAWTDAAAVGSPARSRAGLAAAAVVMLLVLPTFVSERLEWTYRDRPAGELTAELGHLDDDFAGVVTNPVTADYLEAIVRCVEQHPAERVAILPDNPMLYPVLGLDNPFPVVWLIPLEILGSEERIVDAAARIDAEGRYLVLFQPVHAMNLPTIESLARTGDNGFRDVELGERIRAQLSGTAVTCGTFEGIWAP